MRVDEAGGRIGGCGKQRVVMVMIESGGGGLAVGRSGRRCRQSRRYDERLWLQARVMRIVMVVRMLKVMRGVMVAEQRRRLVRRRRVGRDGRGRRRRRRRRRRQRHGQRAGRGQTGHEKLRELLHLLNLFRCRVTIRAVYDGQFQKLFLLQLVLTVGLKI